MNEVVNKLKAAAHGATRRVRIFRLAVWLWRRPLQAPVNRHDDTPVVRLTMWQAWRKSRALIDRSDTHH